MSSSGHRSLENMTEGNYFHILMGACFAYSLVDILLMEADDCMASMQVWTCVSYLNVGVFKIMQGLGQKCSHAGANFIFTFRQRSTLSLAIVVLTWAVFVPFFAIWTVLGTYWFRKALNEHPNCLSMGVHPWLVLFWQVLSYAWLSIYVVYFAITCAIERKMRRAERDMRSIESEDSLLRWGQVSPAGPDVSSIGGPGALKMQQGLQPREIGALPLEELGEGECSGMHCPICLSDFAVGDKVRSLPRCGHYFHQSCVDLWLLRRADCPMCKGKVH